MPGPSLLRWVIYMTLVSNSDLRPVPVRLVLDPRHRVCYAVARPVREPPRPSELPASEPPPAPLPPAVRRSNQSVIIWQRKGHLTFPLLKHSKLYLSTLSGKRNAISKFCRHIFRKAFFPLHANYHPICENLGWPPRNYEDARNDPWNETSLLLRALMTTPSLRSTNSVTLELLDFATSSAASGQHGPAFQWSDGPLLTFGNIRFAFILAGAFFHMCVRILAIRDAWMLDQEEDEEEQEEEKCKRRRRKRDGRRRRRKGSAKAGGGVAKGME